MNANQTRRNHARTITVPTPTRPSTLGAHLGGLTLLVVSEEQAIRNRQLEEGRRMAAREAREELEASARAQLDANKAAGTPAVVAPEQSVAVAETPKVRVIHVPTPEESEALRADINRREEATMKAGRHADALADKGRLLAWGAKTKPSVSAFIEAIIECGFTHSHDDRKAAVYTYQGVDIKVFGCTFEPPRNGAHFDKRMSPEQEKARARRSHQSAPVAAKTAAPVSTGATAQVKTAEERAEEKKAHLLIAEKQRAAKVVKQAAYKAAHPKVKALKVPKKESKADKSGKGGKGKSGDKK